MYFVGKEDWKRPEYIFRTRGRLFILPGGPHVLKRSVEILGEEQIYLVFLPRIITLAFIHVFCRQGRLESS